MNEQDSIIVTRSKAKLRHWTTLCTIQIQGEKRWLKRLIKKRTRTLVRVGCYVSYLFKPEKYITELYTQAENCNYGDLRDEMIRDRLVVGIRDTALSQQLQLDAELTLDKAKFKIRQREAVGEQQKLLTINPIQVQISRT